MKLAFISDIHGNMAALDAVLEDIEKRQVDQIYCGGDIVNPFKESLDVWKKLKELNIPCVRGNHEDYIIKYHKETSEKEGWLAFNRSCVTQVSEYLGADIAKELSEIPFSIDIPGPEGKDIFLYHASFNSNSFSHRDNFTDPMKRFFEEHPAKLFISGHKHYHHNMQWDGKTVVVIGSLGMPLNELVKAQYITCEFKNGEWNIIHHKVDYDPLITLNRFKQEGWLYKAGAIGLLYAEQLITAADRMGPFIRWAKERHSEAPNSKQAWLEECIDYLKFLNRYEEIEKYVDFNSF